MWKGFAAALLNAPICRQLFIVYVVFVALAFLTVLAGSLISIHTLRDMVLGECDETLREQVLSNSAFVLSDAAEVFKSKLATGLRTLALPVAYSIYDASRSGYSIEPPTARYADSNKNTLKAPLTTDQRYPCLGSESQLQMDMRGCTNGLKSISTGASAVYVEGMKLDGSNSQELISENTDTLLTSVIDMFIEKAWSRTTNWTGGYIAVDRAGVYQQYPGWVGNLSTDKFGNRNFNMQNRPWYKNLKAAQANYAHKTVLTAEALDKALVIYSAPYWAWDGNGFLVSINVPVYESPSKFFGVAGTDVNVLALREMVLQIKLRQSGNVHLYHVETGYLAASVQWNPKTSTSEEPMKISDVKLSPDGSGTLSSSSSGCSGQEEQGGFTVVRRPALNGSYCLVAVIPVDEVIGPIEEQRDNIETSTSELSILSTLVLLGVLFGLVLPCSFIVSYQVAAPLVSTSKESDTIVRNIGGNLFQGLRISKTVGGIGEVGHLRAHFIRMLEHLQAKRSRVAIPPRNPIYKSGLAHGKDIEARTFLGKIEVMSSAEGDNIIPIAPPARPAIMIRTRLMLQVVLPILIALIVIIATTVSEMSSKADEWILPVKTAMIDEELQTMEVRCFERSLVMSEIFTSYTHTVAMLKDYTEKTFSGELTAKLAYATPFSPTVDCPSGSTCTTPGVEWDVKMLDNSGSKVRKANYSLSVWYAPLHQTAPTSNRAKASVSIWSSGGTVAQEQEGLASHLENVARVAYFSSKSTDIYWGFENHEAYRGYPYTSLNGYNNKMTCNDPAKTQVPQYTPLCRAWYTDARSANGEIVFGKVDTDALTWLPFISISAGCYATGEKFVGVVSVSANLKEVETLLKETKVYESGMMYMFDEDGVALYHPLMEPEQRGTAQVAEIAAQGDKEFEAAYGDNIVAGWGKTGQWNDKWHNEATGEDEHWFYRYCPVPGTPYQLIITAVDREINAGANELQDKLNSIKTTFLVVTLLLFVGQAFFLIGMTWVFNNVFASPIERLVDVVENGEEQGYTQDIPRRGEYCARELDTVLQNLSKLVIGLRFGNPKYHGGNKLTELSALRAARRLVEETGNQRGIGVCLTNLANCVRSMPASDRKNAHLTAEESSVEGLLWEAVRNARLLAKDPDVDVDDDTVGQRLLGLALVLLDDEQKVPQAQDLLREAVHIHTRTGNWAALARLSSMVMNKPDDRLNALLRECVTSAWNLLSASVTTSVPPTNQAEPIGVMHSNVLGEKSEDVLRTVPARQAADLARLCVSLAWLHKDRGFILWALDNIPNLDAAQITQLAVEAKRDVDEQEVNRVDKYMSVRLQHWRKGPPPPKGLQAEKVIVFVIDRTWKPILRICIESIKTIFMDYVGQRDHVGLYGLGEGWIFPPTCKRTDEQGLLKQIEAAEVSAGQCVLYRSMLNTIDCLNAYNNRFSKWLIVLTDLVDLEYMSAPPQFSEGSRVFAQLGADAFKQGVVESITRDEATVAFNDNEAAVQFPIAKLQPFAATQGLQDNMDPELKRRLEKAGARSGQVTLSLKWDSTDDLDLHVKCPLGSEISYSNRKAENGWLDVDMNPDHNTKEPVENVFWEKCPAGRYVVIVENFSYGGRASVGEGRDISFALVLQSKIPVKLQDGTQVLGLHTWHSSVAGKKGRIEFVIEVPDVPLVDYSFRPKEVCAALQSSALTMAVVDSSKISGWDPKNPKWKDFVGNMGSFMRAMNASGNAGHHLQANNLDGIRQKFEEVAVLLNDSGLEEHL